MNFNSETFFFYFLPVSLFVYYSLLKWGSSKAVLVWLSLASLVFYSWQEPSSFWVLTITILGTWFLSGWMYQCRDHGKRKVFLILILVFNLGFLAYFKYWNFFLNIIHVPIHLESILLPLGISFYTFKVIGYVIDLYYDKLKKPADLLTFTSFVTLFPQLLAGPISRYGDIESQLQKPVVTRQKIEQGLFFFILGLAKKVLIADGLVYFVNMVFDTQAITHPLWTLLGMGTYALELYFDFSGYSDMAVGLGLFLGLQLPQNFNSPYKSKNITEFWTRWHMSLSFWFKDFLFYPLAMFFLRRGMSFIYKYAPHLITMTLIGFWHGASFNFLIFGMIHGIALVVDDAYLAKKKKWLTLRRVFCVVIVLISFVFIRALDTNQALRILSQLGMGWAMPLTGPLKVLSQEVLYSLMLIPVALWIVIARPNIFEMKKVITWRWSLVLSMLLALSMIMMLSQDYVPFIYFQF